MKHEISTMIKQQQQAHAIEMQELYDRLLQQMASMLRSPNQGASTNQPYPIQHSPPNRQFSPSPPTTQSPENDWHQEKRQDTRPSPTKRKTSLPPRYISADTTQKDYTDQSQLPMEIEGNRQSPTSVEEDV
jgi:hypothetical protein